MNNDNFLIEESDITLAQSICNDIKDVEKRNLAMSNVLAAKIAKHYFIEEEADTNSGLHNIIPIIENLNLSDIYVNGSYIDVRLYLEDESPAIPRELFEKDILPTAYMFIKINKEISSASVIGFITPEDIKLKASLKNNFYVLTEDDLASFYDVQNLLHNPADEDYPEDFELEVFNFLDNKHNDVDSFYRKLLTSKILRKYLYNASRTRMALSNIIFEVEETSDKNNSTSNDLIEEHLSDDISTDTTETLEHIDNVKLEIEPTELEEFEELEELGEQGDVVELELNETSSLVEFSQDNNEITELNEVAETDVLPSLDTLEELDNIKPLDELDNLDEQEFKQTEDDIIELDNNNMELTEASDFDTNIQEDKDVEEENINHDFNKFSTLTTPSIDSIEQIEETETNENEIQALENQLDFEEDLLNKSDENEDIIEELEIKDNFEEEDDENTLAENPVEAEEEAEDTPTDENNSSDLDSLFEHSDNNSTNTNEDDYNYGNPEDLDEIYVPEKRKNSKILPLISLVALIGALGYLGYTKFYSTQTTMNNVVDKKDTTAVQKTVNTEKISPKKTATPMPVETVENIKIPKKNNEGTAISIPAIEQNLDASIDVANLTINWEVPSTYISNVTAKKYFTRIGKIIQLNLKTELLLLNKSPITNKILLELEFNNSNNKFEVKEITASSGEKTIDDLIINTVRASLNMNLKTNMNIFKDMAGNPVLIIRL